jgi:hypothetical protein
MQKKKLKCCAHFVYCGVTPWCRVSFDSQVVKKFPAFMESDVHKSLPLKQGTLFGPEFCHDITQNKITPNCYLSI